MGDDLYEPRFDNAKGFFEDKATNQVDEAFLNRMETQWNSLLLPGNVDSEAISAYQESLRESVFDRFKDEQLWGLKDPRISRLWRFWLPLFVEADVNPVFLLASRHPFSVARSLYKRDQMPEAQALALWAIYQLEALEALLEHGGLVVDYDLMMDCPRKEFQRIVSFLGLDSRLDADEVAKFESEFLVDELRHSRYPTLSLASTESPLQRICLAIHSELLAMAQLPGAVTPDEADQVQTRVAGFREELARSNDWMRAIDELQSALTQLSVVHAGTGEGKECEVRLFLSELVDGRQLTYAKFRTATTQFEISNRRQVVRLVMPTDLKLLARIRLALANRPVAIVLHHLALVKADGRERWRWNGDAGSFTNVAGLVRRTRPEGQFLLCLNDVTQFDLPVPKDVLAGVEASDCLLVEMTPQPLLGAVADIFVQDDRLIGELRSAFKNSGLVDIPHFSAGSDFLFPHLAKDLEHIASVLQSTLSRRDQTIAIQLMQLEKLREEILRAEAQLGLLKDILMDERE